MIRSIFLGLLCTLFFGACGNSNQKESSISGQRNEQNSAHSSPVKTFGESMPENKEQTTNGSSNAQDPKQESTEPIDLGAISGDEKQIVLFFPPDSEVQEYVQNEADDTEIILVEHFETESVKLIEKVSGFGCNISTVEMRDVYMLLADKSIFKVERNKDDKMCGVILYQAGKSPKVLSGKLKAEAYVKEVKAYFGIK